VARAQRCLDGIVEIFVPTNQRESSIVTGGRLPTSKTKVRDMIFCNFGKP